ncbi:type II CRISPR-associated endonuclease Cas1 [Planctomicrobium sp. SH664]|uniref:type II CRISPR-associated endonuclease Cas1 n=1 Tax=Planctomicrobium sp. SH664 TaxID=3448125 RepID=UPI003F5C4A8B
MLKRMLEISREPAHVCATLGQLQLKRDGNLLASVPCEDLGVVIVDHPQTTYTHAALAELTRHDAVLVICGSNHLPCGMLLPVSDHTQIVLRLRAQLSMSLPTRKRLWQQLVRAKIVAQAENLGRESATSRRLRQLADRVRSGDQGNREALAARFYWSAWLTESSEASQPQNPFRRDPDGTGLNSLLNYGYAILRAALARAISSSGFHPAIGLQHSHRANAFCLADDLIEPLRPIVDARVRALAMAGETELNQPVKAALLGLLSEEVLTGDVSGPLSVAVQRYVASLVAVANKESKLLTIPVRCKSAATAACG